MTVDSSSIPDTIYICSHYLHAKRVFDITFTLLISFFVLLVIAFVALLIWYDSPGPVILRQRRVGLNGMEFDMLKFRSMYANSDSTIHRQAIEEFMNGQVLNGDTEMPYKLVDDPRITKVGRFIRKTSLDELPQFWNVLQGEMSLVGPRPPFPYETEQYSQRDWLRLYGKPGLTGRWQVYGRSRVSFQEMVEMDIAYLQQQSLREDIKLIALTVPVMIRGRGGA